jgi:DNA replication protein DnaC
MDLTPQLTPTLKALRLSGILATLEARHRQAIDGQWSYIEFLARLLEDETERRAQKQLALRVRRATLNSTKTLEGFDFAVNPTINRQQVLALASGEYIRRHHNRQDAGAAAGWAGRWHLRAPHGRLSAS